MGDKMRPISFERMITWVIKELKEKESIFGIHKNKFYKNNTGKYIELFGENWHLHLVLQQVLILN